MIIKTYADIVTPKLLKGAIENNGHTGFLWDFHVLHCLLRIHKPKSFFEIGTNVGDGVKIIKNALGDKSVVYSLDLPKELAHISRQHPINEGKGDSVGINCDLPYIQLWGNSLAFDFSQYPCEGYFVDAEHTYQNVSHETQEILRESPKIVIYHDTDEPEVLRGVLDSMTPEYDLIRVIDTRMSYLLRK